MKTINVDLEEGIRTIEITSPGYAAYKAKINVTASGVVCVTGDGLAGCSGDPPPHLVVQDLWRVFNYLTTVIPGETYSVEMNMPNGSTLYVDGNFVG